MFSFGGVELVEKLVDDVEDLLVFLEGLVVSGFKLGVEVEGVVALIALVDEDVGGEGVLIVLNEAECLGEVGAGIG